MRTSRYWKLKLENTISTISNKSVSSLIRLLYSSTFTMQRLEISTMQKKFQEIMRWNFKTNKRKSRRNKLQCYKFEGIKWLSNYLTLYFFLTKTVARKTTLVKKVKKSAFETLRWVILLVYLVSYLHLSKVVAPPDFGRSVIPISTRRGTTKLTLAPPNFNPFLRPLILSRPKLPGDRKKERSPLLGKSV